jgi:alkylhydroperoxidase family enzyme
MPFIDVPDGDGSNMEQLFELRPEAFAAWQQLVTAVKATSDNRRYELATLAAARKLRSSYCTLAHGKVLAERFYDFDSVAALPDGLDDADRAIMAFAEQVVADATAITQEDVDKLRGHGLSDDEIFDVVLAATIRCFFSKTLDALGVLPDARFRELEPELQDALVVGRPIADA